MSKDQVLPPNETERLGVLRRYQILDTPSYAGLADLGSELSLLLQRVRATVSAWKRLATSLTRAGRPWTHRSGP